MKRCVLSFFRNSNRDLHCLSSQGSLFHNFGPDTQNARSPPYLRLVRGTVRLCWLTLRRGRFCSGTESRATRYSGAFLLTHLNTQTSILNSIRARTATNVVALKHRRYDQISDVWLRIEHRRFKVFEVCPREHLKYRREERCSNPFWKKIERQQV